MTAYTSEVSPADISQIDGLQNHSKTQLNKAR